MQRNLWAIVMKVLRGILEGKQLCFIDENVKLGKNIRLGIGCAVREGVKIGGNCSFGHYTIIEKNVVIGSNVRVHSFCHIVEGMVVEDGVFIGPGFGASNVKKVTSYGRRDQQIVKPPIIRKAARVGARVLLLPGVEVGENAFVCAGSVVIRDVPDFGIVAGNPARMIGRVPQNE